MTSIRKITSVALLSLAATSALAACGGSDSKSSSSETTMAVSGGDTTETTMAASGASPILTINITYTACTGSTLTITTDNPSLKSAEVTRYDAADVQQRSPMTMNSDGSWSGTIPTGAGYEDRITVFAAGNDGKKSSRSSALPLVLEDGSTSTCN